MRRTRVRTIMIDPAEDGLGIGRASKRIPWSRLSTKGCFPAFRCSPKAITPIAGSRRNSRPLTVMGPLNDLITVTVPTTNPYYPTGAPAGLRVSYDLAAEFRPRSRLLKFRPGIMGGLNLDLPFGWTGKIYGSRTPRRGPVHTPYRQHGRSQRRVGRHCQRPRGCIGPRHKRNHQTGEYSVPQPFLRPASIPVQFAHHARLYRGNDCDVASNIIIDEYGGTFDGPLFDVPAGQVKAAVGAPL